jgi:hypothetical protein
MTDTNNLYLKTNPEIEKILKVLSKNFDNLSKRFCSSYDSLNQVLVENTARIFADQKALDSIKRTEDGRTIATIEEVVQVPKRNPEYSLIQKTISSISGKPYTVEPEIIVDEKQKKHIDLEELVNKIKSNYSSAKNQLSFQLRKAETECENSGPKITELYELEKSILEDKGIYEKEIKENQTILDQRNSSLKKFKETNTEEEDSYNYQKKLLDLQEKRRQASRELAMSEGLYNSCDISLIHVKNLREAYETIIEDGLTPLIKQTYSAEKSMEHSLGQIQLTTSAHIVASGLSQALAQSSQTHLTTSRNLSVLNVVVASMIEKASHMNEIFYQPLIDPLSIQASKEILVNCNDRKHPYSVQLITQDLKDEYRN